MSARSVLINLRKERKLRRGDLAKTLGVGQSYYDKIELGYKEPSKAFLQKVKDKFPTMDMNAFFTEV